MEYMIRSIILTTGISGISVVSFLYHYNVLNGFPTSSLLIGRNVLFRFQKKT